MFACIARNGLRRVEASVTVVPETVLCRIVAVRTGLGNLYAVLGGVVVSGTHLIQMNQGFAVTAVISVLFGFDDKVAA